MAKEDYTAKMKLAQERFRQSREKRFSVKTPATDPMKASYDVKLTWEQLAKLARRARGVVANPNVTWKSDTILVLEAMKKFNGISSYCVKSLRNKAKVLCSHDSAIVDICIDGQFLLEVKQSWHDAVSEVIRFCYRHHKELIDIFYRSNSLIGFLKKDGAVSLEDAINSKEIEVVAASDIEICHILQWLLVVSGYALNNCFIRFVAKDGAKAKIVAKKPVPTSQKPISTKKPVTSKKKKKLGLRRLLPASGGASFASRRTSSSVDYSTHLGDGRGTYVVQNGVVIFLQKPPQVDVDNSSRVCRSGSDSEDTWKGYGIGRPETDGRFGGMIGEDWAD